MSNKLNPLSNSTSALLEVWIWSDATSHATLFTCHVQQLVRTGLSWSQPAWTTSSPHGTAALHNLCWDSLFSCQMICKQHIILNHVFFQYESNLEPVTCQWEIQGGLQGSAPPLFIQILSFSCRFQQKLSKITGGRTTPRDLASSLGNPGSTTVLLLT